MNAIGPEHGIPIPRGLSGDERKRLLFAADTYFHDGWGDVHRLAGSGAEPLLHEHGLILLKPDAAARGVVTTAVEWLAAHGATIAAATPVSFGPHGLRAMWRYQLNASSRDRRDLADLVLGTDPSLLLVLRLPGSPVPASTRLSAMKGPADPARREPGQLRHALGGGNFLLNYVHAADEPADVARELGVLLAPPEREQLLRRVLTPAAPGEALAHARRLAAGLERSAVPHDLELETALAALEPPPAASGEEAAAVRAAIAAIRAEESSDWRGLWRAADAAGVAPSRWDRAVAGTYLMEPSAPGVEALLGSTARVAAVQGAAR